LSRKLDPRPAITRAIVVDTAVSLLNSGGATAVTADAIAEWMKVSRATVYRYFRGRGDLLGAAINASLPHLHVAPEQGSLRQRLTAVLMAQAKSVAEAPVFLAVSVWITLGVHIDQAVNIKRSGMCAESALPASHMQIAERFIAPLKAILYSEDVGTGYDDADRMIAVATLMGPIIFGRLSAADNFDYQRGVHKAVSEFLVAHDQDSRCRPRPHAWKGRPHVRAGSE
jgi:AcrR family transcriptional regulator